MCTDIPARNVLIFAVVINELFFSAMLMIIFCNYAKTDGKTPHYTNNNAIY